MARRLILDTGILIRAERDGPALATAIVAEDDIAIAAITVAELRLGVELASKRYRAARESYVAGIISRIPVLDYDTGVAQVHAKLLAEVRRKGMPRGSHDLLVAATAASTGRTILTTDRTAHFETLTGVHCIVA